jgi:hypothetical protein
MPSEPQYMHLHLLQLETADLLITPTQGRISQGQESMQKIHKF